MIPSKYDEILNDFLGSGSPSQRVRVEGKDNGYTIQMLKKRVKANQMDVMIMMMDREIYLFDCYGTWRKSTVNTDKQLFKKYWKQNTEERSYDL